MTPAPAPSCNGEYPGRQSDAGADWPNPLAEEAFYGLPGEIVRAIEPHTESDSAALLIQLHVAFGNLIGRNAHFRAESDVHFLNLFAVIVGRTSKGRKGTSWGRVRQYVEQVAPDWAANRIQGGLASGEGMVHAVRDPVEKNEPIRIKGRVEGYQTVIEDHGEKDKRLLCVEEEYAGVMRLLERQGNSLSQRMREAWQGRPIGSMTKNSKTVCKEPHISIIAHGTCEEVQRYLTATEMGNGWGNRHLWFCARRSKVLPEGGGHSLDDGLVRRLKAAADFAISVGELKRDPTARVVWNGIYEALSEGKPGMAGAMLGRAEAQVMRLACLYAVLDGSDCIRPEHLKAALAIWDYSEQSVRFIFGDSTGNPMADEILRSLHVSTKGLSRTDISKLFNGNRNAGQINTALLLENDLANFRKVSTNGGPAEVWDAVRKERKE